VRFRLVLLRADVVFVLCARRACFYTILPLSIAHDKWSLTATGTVAYYKCMFEYYSRYCFNIYPTRVFVCPAALCDGRSCYSGLRSVFVRFAFGFWFVVRCCLLLWFAFG
jgi:hypothetical protein